MLKARWFQQYANVNFAFELVTVCKPNINRGGCKCLNLFAKNVDFFFFNGVVYGYSNRKLIFAHNGGYTCDTIQGLYGVIRPFRKASNSLQALKKLLTCESFASRNLFEGKQIQIALV